MPIDFPFDRSNKTTRTRESKPDPRDECAAADRASYGTRGQAPWGARCRAAFYQYLPPAPVLTRGSQDRAKWYVMQIDRVTEMQVWSRAEMEGLRKLRVKWQRRAEGRDSRYLERGTQGGRPAQGRKKSAPEIINAIYDLLDGAGHKTTRPEVRFVQDKAWPYGRPVR